MGSYRAVCRGKITDYLILKHSHFLFNIAAQPVASATIDQCWDSPYRPCGILDSLPVNLTYSNTVAI